MVGSAGFEPTTFTRNGVCAISTGFSIALQKFFIPKRKGPQTRLCYSGARRHSWLDYDPTIFNSITSFRYMRFSD